MKHTILSIFFVILFNALFSQTDSNYVPSIRINKGHKETISNIILTKNNRFLASCSKDKSFIVWDFQSAKEILNIDNLEIGLSSIDINLDSMLVAVGETTKDKKLSPNVTIWDIKTGTKIKTIKAKAGNIRLVKFIENGQKLLIAGSRKIFLYNLITNKTQITYKGFSHLLEDISISNNNKIIAAQSEHKIYYWNIESSKLIRSIEETPSKITSLCLNSVGSKIAICSSNSNIIVYDTSNVEQAKYIPIEGYNMENLSFSKDESFLIGSDSKSKFIHLFYLDSIKTKKIEAHQQVALAFISNNSQYIISTGTKDKQIKIWNPVDFSLIKIFKGVEKIEYQQIIKQDQKFILLNKQRNKVKVDFIPNNLNNKILKDKIGEISSVALSSNNKILAYGNSKNKIKVFDLNSLKQLFTFSHHSWVRVLKFSPNSKLLASACFEELKIWDTYTGKELASFNKEFQVPLSMAFSNDNKLIAIGSRKSVKIFNVRTKQLVHSFEVKSSVYSIDFSSDNKLLLTGEGFKNEHNKYKILVWNLETGKNIEKFDGHNRQITNVKFCQNDSLIISTGNKKIKIWNRNTGKKIKEIDAHSNWINNLSINTNQDKLSTSSIDATNKIWDIKTGKLERTIIGFKDNNWAAYTPDGSVIGSPKGKSNLYTIKNLKVSPFE